MASVWCLAAAPAPAVFSPSRAVKITNGAVAVSQRGVTISLRSRPCALRRRRRDSSVCMAVSADWDEGEWSYQHHLDFPFEYARPKPPERMNVYPKFPKMPRPMPTWLPYDQLPDDDIAEDEEEDLDEEEDESGPGPDESY